MPEDLKEKWIRSGIEAGDTVLLHSDIKRTLIEARRQGLRIGPEDILRSFIDVLGPDGTLLLPLFNFDFAAGIDFDIRHTPSQMGALTESGRRYEGAVRTGHPIYSFAVIGAKSDEFKGLDNESGYSDDSPFGVLRRLNGKIASLDLSDQKSMTFYHHVEELKGVDYRYFKSFMGRYTDDAGRTTARTYKLYVRDLSRGVRTDVDPAGELMWAAGLYKGSRPKVDTGLRVIRSRDMFEFVATLIDESRALGTLYSIEK
jgi:aminoglycoside 3-N-acetyltransferase